DAADSLGYTPVKKFFRIILPQVIPIALPGWGNALIYLIHNSSLVFAIGVIDMMGRADLISDASFGVYQLRIYLIIAVFYCIIAFLSDRMVRLFEKRTEKYQLDVGIKGGGM